MDLEGSFFYVPSPHNHFYLLFYPSEPKYESLRQLILHKEKRDEVCFLKPPDFHYNGDLYHGDPGAFPRASKWIQKQINPMTGKWLVLPPTYL
jgi:hypothetical protein